MSNSGNIEGKINTFFLKWAFILKENATFALQMLHVHQTTGMLALESEFTICDSYKRTLWSVA